MDKEISENRIYLDSYILQKDYRIRFPKSAIINLNAVPGETMFDIFLDTKQKEIILRISEK